MDSRRVQLIAYAVFLNGLTAQQTQTPAAEAAPSPAIVENRGKPMAVPFRCTAEDIRWAGLSCTDDEPCPIFLELSAVGAAGNRLFVAGNIHAESVTLYSTLLSGEITGQSWSEAHERIRGAGLDRIQFLNPDIGWVSGQELFPIPQNPFLLLTSDGGKTWTTRPVLDEGMENRFGSVQQFFFSTKESGFLLLDRGQGNDTDRYAMFESRNGGESWNIRQESGRPLRLKETPPLSDWRVRVDAATRAFRIEHRLGEKWASVASFAVRLDSCKPPPASEPAAADK